MPGAEFKNSMKIGSLMDVFEAVKATTVIEWTAILSALFYVVFATGEVYGAGRSELSARDYTFISISLQNFISMHGSAFIIV